MKVTGVIAWTFVYVPQPYEAILASRGQDVGIFAPS